MFTNLYKKLNKSVKVSKHQASKKGYKHIPGMTWIERKAELEYKKTFNFFGK